METFTQPKEFVDNPHYRAQRQGYLDRLDMNTVDRPIVEIIDGFSKLPYCFTLQSCYGHFVHDFQKHPHNIEPLPDSDSILPVEYRIAYLALCVENSDPGRALFRDLEKIPAMDTVYVQFGSADWFWERQVNTYVLQVEPERYMMQDRAVIGYQEALYIEEIRHRFFTAVNRLVQKRLMK